MPHLPEHTLILNRLRDELPEYLHYHSLGHTLDVLDCCARLADHAKITEPDRKLLLTAAAYHDAGYIYQAAGHEQRSWEIAKETLPAFGYSEAELEVIQGLILATRVPQRPQTALEEIICDADLDYLGRPDFPELSARLFHEMRHLGIVANQREWDLLQEKFLSAHTFFTAISKQTRQEAQDARLTEIRNSLKNES